MKGEQHAMSRDTFDGSFDPSTEKARHSLICERHSPPSRQNAGKSTHRSLATGCASTRIGSLTAGSSPSSPHRATSPNGP